MPAWTGEFVDDNPFYYHIISPVAFMEFDFHCGTPLQLDAIFRLLIDYRIEVIMGEH